MVKALKVRTINLRMEPAFRHSVESFRINTHTFDCEGRRIGRSVSNTSACFERFGKVSLSAFTIVLAGYIFKEFDCWEAVIVIPPILMLNKVYLIFLFFFHNNQSFIFWVLSHFSLTSLKDTIGNRTLDILHSKGLLVATPYIQFSMFSS